MPIMGGNKAREIDYVPMLAWYQQVFRDALCQGDTRLMVIGYGFRDEHINRVIIDAVDNHGLKLFIVSPDGADHARKINSTHGAVIFEKSKLGEVFERGLIGASRRTLRETFGQADSIERAKFDRFFAN
jgi:SIR2-like domain